MTERLRREIRTECTPLLDMELQTRKYLDWGYTLYKLYNFLGKGKFVIEFTDPNNKKLNSQKTSKITSLEYGVRRL